MIKEELRTPFLPVSTLIFVCSIITFLIMSFIYLCFFFFRSSVVDEPTKTVRYYVTDMTLGESRVITYEATERPKIRNGVVTFTRKDSARLDDIIKLGPGQSWSIYEMVER
jgi:hypothetical protein